jgi:hypothetical protein
MYTAHTFLGGGEGDVLCRRFVQEKEWVFGRVLVGMVGHGERVCAERYRPIVVGSREIQC